MGRVDGKVVVVTGAASGQGAAEAAALRRDGATVIATDVIAGEGIHRLDVGDPQGWAALAADLPRVDALVNNAGITHRARLLDVAVEDFERVQRVNLIGPLLGIQALAPLMPPGGSIVNVSSLAGVMAHFPVAYTASKWALRGLSRVASLELGPRGIRVNTLLPGYIETPMTASAAPAFQDASLAAIPLGRLGAPGDVAPLVVFLVSDESAFISGAEIAVDGGQAAHAGAKALSDAVAE
jgi:3alpha(or 20beta)-hydroxysteroid dehydrogenase